MDGKSLNELLGAGYEIAGSITGAVVGTCIAGPVGTILGASIPTVISKGLKKISDDVLNRNISQREEQKIGAGYVFAIDRIEKNINEGKIIRNDGFIDNDNILSDSNIILEGITTKLQKEWELKKLQFYGNFLGNISFATDVNFNYATVLLKIAENLSYRQLCLIKVFKEKDNQQIDLSHISREYKDGLPIHSFNYSLYSDLIELERLSIFQRRGGVTIGNILGKSELSEIGNRLYKLMNLDEIQEIDYMRTKNELQSMVPDKL